jgi:hypothetical protein
MPISSTASPRLLHFGRPAEDALDWRGALLLLLFSPDDAKEQDAGQANNACQHCSPDSGRADASLKQKDQRGGCADHLGLSKNKPENGSPLVLRPFDLAGRVHLFSHSRGSATRNQRRPGYIWVTNWRRGGNYFGCLPCGRVWGWRAEEVLGAAVLVDLSEQDLDGVRLWRRQEAQWRCFFGGGLN